MDAGNSDDDASCDTVYRAVMIFGICYDSNGYAVVFA